MRKIRNKNEYILTLHQKKWEFLERWVDFKQDYADQNMVQTKEEEDKLITRYKKALGWKKE